MGSIPEAQNPHKVFASYAKDLEMVVFNGHVHTTELYEVDGVKYFAAWRRRGRTGPDSSWPDEHQGPAGLSAGSLLEGGAAQGGI